MGIRLGVIGAQGRMGKRVTACSKEDKEFSYTWGLLPSSDILSLPPVDVIIDFSTKEALSRNLQLAREKNTPIVIGTTGIEEEPLKETAQHIPLFWSPNFSLGATITAYIAEKLSTLLPNMVAHVEETHHVHKKDSPSGSAILIKEALIKGSKERSPKIISHREGEVIGKHSAIFTGKEELLTLSHEASSRDAFAKGALEAAKFLTKQKKGFYKMKDLLSFLI